MENAAKNRFARPRILIVSPFLPYPPRDGGRLKMYNAIKSASGECDIILLSFTDDRDAAASIAHLKIFCHEVFTVQFGQDVPAVGTGRVFPEVVKLFYSERLRSELERIINSYPIDIVQVEYGFMAHYGEGIRHIPTILVEHDTSLLSLSGSYERPLRGKWARIRDWVKKVDFHKNAYRRFDKIIVFTDEEKRTVRRMAPAADISIVPIGIETGSYSAHGNGEHPFDLMFVGYMGHYPNVDGLSYFCREIFPAIRKRMSRINLHIIGSRMTGNLPKIDDVANIIFTGEVEDIRPYLAKAKVFVAPLRCGGGLRVKILEAMAMGLPVVATPAACRGIRAVPGKDILIANGPRAFAESVVNLVENEELRVEMGRNARACIMRYYDCADTQRQLQSVYREIMGEHR
jgi:polysaccharide biosynthesis protein PslH